MIRIAQFVAAFFLAVALIFSSCNVSRQRRTIDARDKMISELFEIDRKHQEIDRQNQALIETLLRIVAQYERTCVVPSK